MIADDGGLHAHGVLKPADSVLPAALGVGDELLLGADIEDIAP